MPLVQPATNFNFMITMWDVTGSLFGSSALGAVASAAVNVVSQAILGAFSEVQGLNSEFEIETYQEGGRNDSPHRFVKYAKFDNLTLKRGVTFNTDLADWWAQVSTGKQQMVRKDGMILLHDRNGIGALGAIGRVPIAAWKFKNALPQKLDGPTLNAKGNEIAIETLELSHEGIQRVSPSLLPGLGDLAASTLGGL